MTEVSQLNEMHAVLIASKEDNNKKRQEEKELMDKIKAFERRLEEGVAFTNRYRATKLAATGRLRKRIQALDDLFLKLEHVGRQISDVYLSRISSTKEGVEDRVQVFSRMKLDLKAASERSAALVERLRVCCQQENSKSSSTVMRSKESEIKELGERVEELDVQCTAYDQEATAAETTHAATVEVIQSRRTDQKRLVERLSSADATREQIILEIAGIAADMGVADRAWNDERGVIAAQRDSIMADTYALELRLAELSGEVADQARQLANLDTERNRLAESGAALANEVDEAERQCRQDCPEVVDLRNQLQQKRQRRQILADQLAASEGVIAAHSAHQPEFDTRRAEHQELLRSIASLRTTREGIANRKAAIDEQVRLASVEAAPAMETVKAEISALTKDGARLLDEKMEAAAALDCAKANLVSAQQRFASLEGETSETSVALKALSDAEGVLKTQAQAQGALHDQQIAQCQAAVEEKRDETREILLALEKTEVEIRAAEERALDERRAREKAAKQAAMTEALTREVAIQTSQVEEAQAEELSRLQDEILSEDARLRTACTSSSPGDGTEERLQIDLTELRGEEALLRSEVDAAELRIQRLSGEAAGGDK